MPVPGIEPESLAWQTSVLPLNYTGLYKLKIY